MKKLDKLIIQSFIGPFILTFLVVVFILLMQHMLRYFDDIIGKDLGWSVISQLLFYFAIFMVPVAMPLAVLLSSLITFGNLGEHFELTAIKSSGISLLRTLQPIFFFVIILTGIAFYVNNNLVPKAALEAYSLLYDIKQKKPALDLREGTFYSGLGDISIKVDKKFPEDPAALKKIIVYDHQKKDGNKEVYIADSGRMTTILNERYLKFELFDGYNYSEGANEELAITGQKNNNPTAETLRRTRFKKTQVVYDLSSFQLARTDKKWFQGNRIMRNLRELDHDIDSINNDVLQQRLNYYLYRPTYFNYLGKKDPVVMPNEVSRFQIFSDSIERIKHIHDTSVAAKALKSDADAKALNARKSLDRKYNNKYRSWRSKNRISRNKDKTKLAKAQDSSTVASTDSVKTLTSLGKLDSSYSSPPTREMIQAATNMARQVKSQIVNTNTSIASYNDELTIFEIQWHLILANSLACVAMFLIGAPLGAIIKKGGLGVPFLVSIIFFIVYYILGMQGQKLAKQDAVSAMVGVWAADIILFTVGLIFLRQARNDARLFEADFYRVIFDKVSRWFRLRRLQSKAIT